MNAAARQACSLSAVATALVLALALTGPAHSAPLGLSIGDVITSIEWDALQSAGDGGAFDVSTNLFSTDGRITAVVIDPGTTITQSGVQFMFSLDFISETLNINLANDQVFGNVILDTPGLMPDVVVKESGVNILFGNFTSPVVATGNIDTNLGVSDLVAIGRITITGGDADLVNALGGAGVGQANLLLTASLFNFTPSIVALLADNVIFNSNFVVDLSGTLIPLNSTGFVPEPSTALLLGGGLLLMVGVARRGRR